MRLRNILDQDYKAFMDFAKDHPEIVPPDHVLQKLIIFNFMEPFLRRFGHKEILEVGCGLGFHSTLLSRYGHVSATELEIPGSFMGADGDVEAGRKTVFRELSRGDIAFTHNDGKTLPFPNEYFDVVYHNSVIEHVPDVTDFIRELRRILKPGGITICITGTPALCIFRYIRDYFLKLPLLVAASLLRESGLTKRRRSVTEQVKKLLGKNIGASCVQIEMGKWYARLFHYINNPAYNSPIIESLAVAAGSTPQQALEGVYNHFRTSLWHRFNYYLTPKTHGQHYSGFIHEMREWKVSCWRNNFSASGFEVLEVVPYRFHHFLELTRNTKINTALYHLAVPVIERLSGYIPPSLCSEFILVAQKTM